MSHTDSYDSFGLLQERGDESQAESAGQGDSGWDGFGSAEETERETTRASKTEANWGNEVQNSWTACRKHRDTQQSEYESFDCSC